MTVQRYVFVIAGFFIMCSLALGCRVKPAVCQSDGHLPLPPLSDLNLFQYGFTGFCPMAMILKKTGRARVPQQLCDLSSICWQPNA
jgi:hypothetical protein